MQGRGGYCTILVREDRGLGWGGGVMVQEGRNTFGTHFGDRAEKDCWDTEVNQTESMRSMPRFWLTWSVKGSTIDYEGTPKVEQVWGEAGVVF